MENYNIDENEFTKIKDKIKYKYTEGDKIREDESGKVPGTELYY